MKAKTITKRQGYKGAQQTWLEKKIITQEEALLKFIKEREAI